jgi:hypothetical protein
VITFFKWLWRVDRPMFVACITVLPMTICLLIHGFTQSLFWKNCYYLFLGINLTANGVFWWKVGRKRWGKS